MIIPLALSNPAVTVRLEEYILWYVLPVHPWYPTSTIPTWPLEKMTSVT